MTLGKQSKAIVLDKVAYSDSDLIITFLTEDFGKIKTFAPYAKKSKKRFSGALDVFSKHSIEFKKPIKNQLNQLLSSRTLSAHYNISKFAYNIANAFYISECINRLLAQEQKQDSVFNWWSQSLQYMNKEALGYEECLKLDLFVFELCGYKPNLKKCSECESQPSAGSVFFSYTKGMYVCEKCMRSHRHFDQSEGILVSVNCIEFMLKAYTDENSLSALKLNNSEKNQMMSLAHGFMNFILSFKPKSQQYRWDMMHEKV